MGKSAIGWTDETWNCIRGCTQISPGCANCYAKHQAARIVRMSKGRPSKYDGLVRITARGEPAWTGRVAFDPETLTAPFHWKAPRRVFVNSMSDLFHEDLLDDEIDQVFAVMALTSRHTYLILTKRSDRMRQYITTPGRHEAWSRHIRRLGPHAYFSAVSDEWFVQSARHIWLGVSVEDRKHGVPRIADLRATPATNRMLSCEPLLEDLGTLDLTGIGWVIDGCESAQGDQQARPAKREWFREIEGQCHVAGIPYFHKQEMVDGKLVHDFPGRQEFPA